MRHINLIVIHCSATPNGVAITPEQIDRWHQQAGFKRDPAAAEATKALNGGKLLKHIGYHWVVSAEGHVHQGRARQEVGAHVAGHNAASIGICMVGTDRYYFHQWLALQDLLCTLTFQLHSQAPVNSTLQPLKYKPKPELATERLKYLGIRVCGHRDLSPDKDGDGAITSRDWLKTCPGFDVAKWLDNGMLPEKAHIFNPRTVSDPSPLVRAGQ